MCILPWVFDSDLAPVETRSKFFRNSEDVLAKMQGFVSRGAPDGRRRDGGRELIASELKLLDRAYEN